MLYTLLYTRYFTHAQWGVTTESLMCLVHKIELTRMELNKYRRLPFKPYILSFFVMYIYICDFNGFISSFEMKKRRSFING